MDSLDIKGLSVNTRIGVHNWEQRIAQRLLIDINIPADLSACNDEIDKTIDYDKLCQRVTEHVESNAFKLIETVANTVAEIIKNEFNIAQVTVSVSKPHAVKNASDIRVTVQR
ncbi:MAG: dihydroneopterin aldolase [Legionella sp.]|nr:dihydroneopterin aldolase [Legionella sp.]